MFTVYDEEKEELIKVEEPDPSLSYTYADYLQWKFEERVELIKGRIYKMSPAPNLKHQQVSGKIFVRIFTFLEGKKCQVLSAPIDVRLPLYDKKNDKEITTVIQPDICIVCDENKLDERGCCGAPDLLIEILSPGNTKKEVKIKFGLYQESGVKEYWVVYPVEQNIAVFILNENGQYDGARIYASGDKVRSSAVNGLTMEIDDIFGNQSIAK